MLFVNKSTTSKAEIKPPTIPPKKPCRSFFLFGCLVGCASGGVSCLFIVFDSVIYSCFFVFAVFTLFACFFCFSVFDLFICSFISLFFVFFFFSVVCFFLFF